MIKSSIFTSKPNNRDRRIDGMIIAAQKRGKKPLLDRERLLRLIDEKSLPDIALMALLIVQDRVVDEFDQSSQYQDMTSGKKMDFCEQMLCKFIETPAWRAMLPTNEKSVNNSKEPIPSAVTLSM